MQRLLMVGFGDVAQRLAPLLRARYQLLGVGRSSETRAVIRAAGATPIAADLDRRHSLRRLPRADVVVHLAPPQASGERDLRSRNLIGALSRDGRVPRCLIYISTSGVYGDCGGQWVSETRPVNPTNARAKRRADAERVLRRWGQRAGVRVVVLRVPGIYAAERLPLERIRRGQPALRAEEDAMVNHINADDLALAICCAIRRGRHGRVYNICDDTPLAMGEYFDLIADAFGLPRVARVSRQQARQQLTDITLSFMNESRRLRNGRMRHELGVKLRYPSVAAFLAARAQR